MRTLRLHAQGDVRVHDEETPTPGPDESLVRVEAVGLCGSDLHWFGEGGIGDAVITRPIVPGHEMAGTAMSGPHEGQLVAIDPAIPCGHCPLCEEGHRNLCANIRFSGHSNTDGSLREQMAWPTHLLYPLPEGMSANDGAMLEPLGVALHAWDLAHVRVGATVAVIGCGPIGLMMIQLALTSGARRVIAVDPLPHRRQAALRYGAEVALTDTEALDASTWQELSGLGCDNTFEISGHPDAVAEAMLAARPGSRVVLAGIPGNDVTAFSAGTARRKGLTVMLVRRMKEMYERCIDLVTVGRLDVSSLVTDVYGLADSQQAFEAADARAGLKTVIDPNR